MDLFVGRPGARLFVLFFQMLALAAASRWAARTLGCFAGHPHLSRIPGMALQKSSSHLRPRVANLRGGLRAASGSSEEPEDLLHKVSRYKTAKFLVDLDAEGKELSRRKKPPGRTPNGYVDAGNGVEWVRRVAVGSVPMDLSSEDRSEAGNSWRESVSILPQGYSVLGVDSLQGWPSALPLLDRAYPMGNMPPLDETLWNPPPEKWVIFSDLHVSRSTLSTCLAVLDLVHQEAKKRKAGVIFLGDFWHERGLLRVEPLNAVLNALSSWEVPLLALPGNHDQTSLDGSMHSLTPLAFALPSARIVSEPTVLMGALWMPYRRQYGMLKQRMYEFLEYPPPQGGPAQSLDQENDKSKKLDTDGSKVRAIFCHMDVVGADMGGGVIAERGMHVDDFPAHLPVYTGHYHKPHTVSGKEPREHPVRYVGSPYQTSMSEAGEEKALLVVDSSTWLISEEIPLSSHMLGRRHFRANSLEMLMERWSSWKLQPGDRVQVRVEDAQAARDKIASFGASGVNFEIREEDKDEVQARIPRADTLDAIALFDMYFQCHNTTVSARAREMARSVLEEVVACTPAAVIVKRNIVFESVELRGYGSFGFAKSVEFPLAGRGVVLIVGRNDDEASSDSNGSGKTTLCMAALWALTGNADVRADGKSPTRKDVVHSISPVNNKTRTPKINSTASVTLKGTVNGQPLVICRTSNNAKSESHTLSLSLGGRDLTQQGVKETQEELERLLPVSVLADAVFHGQHLVKGLLERTDKDFKTALDNIIPSEVWDAALESARARKKSARVAKEELSGRLKEKEGEMQPLRAAADAAERNSSEWARERSAFLDTLKRELKVLQENQMREGLDVIKCRMDSQAAQAEVVDLTKKLEAMVEQGSEVRRKLDQARRSAENTYLAAHSAHARAFAVAQQGRARFEELERASQRLQSGAVRIAELVVKRDEWAKGRGREVDEAKSRLHLAEAHLSQALSKLDEDVKVAERQRQDAVAARDRAENEYESAYGSHVNASRALDVARDRRVKYAALEGNPTCPLCLQGVDSHRHKENLFDMTAEEELCSGRAKDAEAEWKIRNENREKARSQAAHAEKEYVKVSGEGRERVLRAEGDRDRVKDAMLRAEQAQWGESAALDQAQRERQICEKEVNGLIKAVWQALGQDMMHTDAAASDGSRHTDLLQAVLCAEKQADALSAEAANAARAREDAARQAELHEDEAEKNSRVLRGRINAARDRAQLCASREDQAMAYNNSVWDAKRRIEKEEGVVNPYEANLQRCRRALETSTERVDLLRKEYREWEAQLSMWVEVDELFGKKGLQNFVYEVAVLELQSRAARYLERLSDDSLRLVLKLKDQVVERTLLSRLSDGNYASRSLHQLSGGQWRRLSLALTLAFSECSLERTGTSCNLLVLDEVMQHLDSEGCTRVGNLLQGMITKHETGFSTALVILQTSIGEELGDTFDQIDVVIKKGDCSYVKSHDGLLY